MPLRICLLAYWSKTEGACIGPVSRNPHQSAWELSQAFDIFLPHTYSFWHAANCPFSCHFSLFRQRTSVKTQRSPIKRSQVPTGRHPVIKQTGLRQKSRIFSRTQVLGGSSCRGQAAVAFGCQAHQRVLRQSRDQRAGWQCSGGSAGLQGTGTTDAAACFFCSALGGAPPLSLGHLL